MSGFRTWTPAEVIRADDVQDYLQNQTVMVFPSDAVRSTAIVVPIEGMLSWNESDDAYQYYDGASWEDLIVPISGGTAGQAYVSNGTALPGFGDVKAQFIATTLQDKTANYTVQVSDTNTVLNLTTAATVTVPDILVEVGDRVDIFMNATSGTVSIVAGTGITSWAGAGTAGTATEFTMPIPYTAASVIKTASQTYRVIGRVFA
jgi:hypothetical protein